MIEKLDKAKMTAVFNILREGRFLSRNTPVKSEQKIYRYVENHAQDVIEYFSYIGIELKIRDGYCYFSSKENREQKLKTIIELLDIISFFLDFDPLFGVGYRFQISDIEKRIKDDVTLSIKLKKIKNLNSDTLHATIVSLVNKVQKRGFIALEDEFSQKYIVLDSFEYIMEFFNKIEIKE